MQKIYNCVRIVFPILLIMMGVGCQEVLNFSDKAEVLSFTIDSYSPKEIDLGAPQLKDDTIVIPLLYGKYHLPLTLSTQIITSEGVAIRNLEQDSIVFFDLKQEVVFYIQTESGLPIKKTIKLRELPRSNKAIIESASLPFNASHTVTLDPKAMVRHDGELREVCFYLVAGTYPVTINPQFVLSDSAVIAPHSLVPSYTFEKESSVFPIDVVAADGLVSQWQLRLVRYKNIEYEEDAISPIVKASLYLTPQELTVSAGASQNGYVGITNVAIDAPNGEIVLTVVGGSEAQPTSKVPFPIDILLNFPLSNMRQSIDYEPLKPLSFKEYETEHKFFLVNSYYGYKKSWQVRLNKWINNKAEIESFKIVSSTPASVVLNRQAEINKATSTITIEVLEGGENFPLTIKTQHTISDNATVTGLVDNSPIVFEKRSTQRSFEIKAEDGTVQKWNIKLRVAGELSDEADIESFEILGYTSEGNRMVINTTPSIDREARIITLEILDWARFFPLTVNAKLAISYGAQVVMGAQLPIDNFRFTSLQGEQRILLRSQNGEVDNTWIVKLNNVEKPKSDKAEMLTFEMQNPSSDYVVDETRINHNKREIVVMLSQIGTAPFYFTPTITISPEAHLSGIASGDRITFNSLSDKSLFTITSEDELVSNAWNIRLLYAPQLPNSNFNSWSDGNTLVTPGKGLGWSSSNNSFIRGLLKSVGRDDTPAARIISQQASIIGVNEMAAGTLFLGWFNFNISLKDDPKAMTYFGIPFKGVPSSLSFEYKYKSSDLYKIVGGKPEKQEGRDRGGATIRLLHYTGSGDIDYHDKGETSVIVLGEGMYEFNDQETWKNFTLPIQYNNPDNLPVTHIHLNFFTSYMGDLFVSGNNSVLEIDNVKLNYE